MNKVINKVVFNEELINEANTLKLNIEKDTMIQNDKGERRIFDAEDIKNKDAIGGT